MHANCGCQDPIVFGHHHPNLRTTWNAGETFTSLDIAIQRTITQLGQINQAATEATWNWTKLAQTPGFLFELRETPRNPAES